MTEKRPSSTVFWPLMLIFFGIIFLLDNFGYLDFGDFVSRYWPLILILMGLKILWGRRGSIDREIQLFGVQDEKTGNAKSAKERESFDTNATEKVVENVFGDVRLNFQNRTVEGFRASNVFGDFDLDFSQASLHDKAIIQVSGVFGDINICLPSNIHLEVQADFVAGSSRILDNHQSGVFKKVHFSTPTPGEKSHTVYVKASIIFGDIWIYNSVSD